MYHLATKSTAKKVEENASMSFSDTDDHACIVHDLLLRTWVNWCHGLGRHAWVDLVFGKFINKWLVRNLILPFQPIIGLNL